MGARRTAALSAAGLLAAVASLSACGSGAQRGPRSEPGADAPHRAAPLGVPRRPAPPQPCRVEAAAHPTAAGSLAAVVRRGALIRSLPGGGHVLARVGRVDPNGYPTVLGIVGARAAGDRCAVAAYRVQLPVPPNGRSGWIDARALRVYPLRSRIVVDLSRRRLVAYRGGRETLSVPVGVGAPATPTPVGRYFVNERWLLASPDGPFGVAALGISAHSNVLRDWLQGGPIALHGTNEPWTIGRAASHGCVRLANADMRRLLPLAPAGTPVTIRR